MGFIRERKLKNGNTRYQAEIRLKGHPMLTAAFDRKTDAKAWVHKVEADIRCGRHQLYSEGKRHTLTEAIQRYFKEQPVTVVKRGHLLWWQRELGSFYLQDVRSSVLTEKKQKLLSESTKKGVIRSKSTCNRYLATLSHLMGVCIKQWEWTSENPVKKIPREKEPRERARVLSPEERHRLFEACKQSANPFLFTFVVLLLGTGCRYNEIRCLKWTDVDIFQGKITITKTKNSDICCVPIRGLPLKLLVELSSKSSSIGYVFPSPNKSKPIELRRAFRTAIKRADLQGFRGHDCRHFYASEMLAQGLSLGEIGRLLNQRSVASTRRYAHLVESRSIDAVSKMSEQVFQGVN
ncbi:MAG: site-specific integrase [Verrucomicrobia bacterium]|nr:site-specific integrase [Verrucomicrobiota bacterium]